MGKGLQTHLVPKEKEAREMGERSRSWADYYGGPDLPQCGGLTLAGGQVPTRAALSLPSFNKWEKRHNETLVSRDKDRERSLTNYRHEQNRPNLEREFI